MTEYSPIYEPRWSNCAFWAAHQFRREGGYILIRRGHHGVPIHVLWSPDHINVWSYEPLSPLWLLRNWHSDLLILFRGHVVKGDDLPSGGASP